MFEYTLDENVIQQFEIDQVIDINSNYVTVHVK